MGLVGEAAVEANFGEGVGGLDDAVAGFLDAEVPEVFLGRHVEGGFEFPQKTGEGKASGFSELGDGDVFAVVLVEELEGGSEFFVYAERGGSLIERAGDADDAANQMWNDVNDLVGYLKSDHIPKKYHKELIGNTINPLQIRDRLLIKTKSFYTISPALFPQPMANTIRLHRLIAFEVQNRL